MTSFSTSELSNSSNGSPVVVSNSGPKSFAIELQSLSNLNINLGEAKKLDISVSATNGFSGAINLSVDRLGLATLDAANDIVISPAEIPLDLQAGETKNVEITITTKTMANSGAGRFSVVATPVSTAYTGEVKLNFDINVNPVYEVRVLARVNNVMVYDRDLTLASFRPHTNGLTVRFINMDTTLEHTIHGSGRVTHQNANNPLDVATATGPVAGGVYEVRVMPATTPSTGAYHCHIHGGQDHQMRFNVQ